MLFLQVMMGFSNKILFIRRSKCGIYLVCLMLCGLAFLFFACEQQEIPAPPQEEPVVWDGEKIVLNITVSENDFGTNEVLTRQAASPFPENRGGAHETAVVRVSDDITMYATLKEDETPVELRAGGDLVRLTSGSQVCVVAYHIFAGDTTYYGHAFYSAVDALIGSFLSSGSPLTVLPEMEYRFVAFSYDATFPMTYIDPVNAIPPLTPVIWGDTIATVSPSSFNLHITMHHLTSKVSLTVNSLPTGVLINEIHSIGVARIHAALPELKVKEGELVAVNTGFGYGRFSFVAGSPSVSKTSALLYPFPAPGEIVTELEIDSLVINGTLYTGPVLNTSPATTEPFKVVYSKPIEVGTNYTLQVYLHHASGGSADRITLHKNGGSSPKLVITNDPTDPGLFFKFGGVVGINGNFGTYNAGADIHFNPSASSYTPFSAVPSYASTDLVNNVSVNAYHNLANIKSGKGDPCRLIGMEVDEILQFADDAALYLREAALKATGEGGWRLPTPMENLRFSGLPGALIGYADHWWDCQGTGTNTSPFGDPGSSDVYKQNVEGGEFPTRGSNNSIPDGSKFLPNAGHINNNGSHDGYPSGFPSASSQSFYWSSDPGNNSFGGAFYFHFALVYPMFTMPNQGYGATVRCVRDESPFTIEVEDWINGGPIGTPGGEGEIILP